MDESAVFRNKIEEINESQTQKAFQPNLYSEEITDELISQAILKRRAWGKKYRISDGVIFNLYSEFSSMIMISKYEIQKQHDDEQKNKNKVYLKSLKNNTD